MQPLGRAMVGELHAELGVAVVELDQPVRGGGSDGVLSDADLEGGLGMDDAVVESQCHDPGVYIRGGDLFDVAPFRFGGCRKNEFGVVTEDGDRAISPIEPRMA